MRILTFDIEDWFHLLDIPEVSCPTKWDEHEPRAHLTVPRILNELEQTNTKATFFCLGWMAERYPELIKSIDEAGHEIGTHSFAHQLAYNQTPADFESDLRHSVEAISNITRKPVKYYRAPGFSITEDNKWAIDCLISNGIEIDCSLCSASTSHGGGFKKLIRPSLLETRKGRIKEFPLTLGSLGPWKFLFSGGGHFRFWPYRFIQRQMRSNPFDYTMTYFHPRDFDSGQPRLEGLSKTRHFKAYVGVSGAFSKFQRMLREFPFQSVGQADAKMDWCAIGSVQM